MKKQAIIELWVKAIMSGSKKESDIPEKLKADVLKKLEER